ncbi:MAG: protein-L-isoaspartate(D-aspartate) O-methyltransferase [gamma proteobacterium symbiont of Bathyaustriella thionipta]|nr:protein-L-isoaspartate(D-aspartate) O-methyltransferase [gamma proteobacterium symbiont of Bathyaustriella thionipta]MCU7951001.1 protein-L-isoaspartate(D-aspartate) O-methyltransferase [gamma proteobacterium symbiont of Bathyaustriella thionipta]MCU7951842.1 protein-L-isoaspartate(D-aspartate) O-methyltransferase [gamma proteobacterium symbiont of Bathyaustriella thionipta]MCU7957508.1 protein-L-isoaspartate(D-aspartate) O-methyltransferase [gamma proteobacterium symbiont of Bathyaustriella 
MSISVEGVGMTSQRTRDRLIYILKEQGIRNEQVLNAIASVPRHLFVDEALSSRAYENISLPIGHGQTISQPYMVARMTEVLLESDSIRRVLEVGTGSGYQTAILSKLVFSVFSVERIKPLLDNAREKFRQLRLNNVLTQYSDGGWGWSQKAPFDAIIVTAAPEILPTSLLEQLVDGGKLIIPVGSRGEQELLVFQRVGDKYHKKALEKVSFVPLLKGKVSQ